MPVASGVRIVFVMAANEEEASTIARTLVEERLAACVNIITSVRSIYRWRGAIEESCECLLLIKTRANNYRKLEHRVKQLHSYEVPEVVATSLSDGSADYLKWITESTTQPVHPRRKPSAQLRRSSPRASSKTR